MTYYRSLLPATVGFDRLLSTIDEFADKMVNEKMVKNTYPPYNIIKENDKDYMIEIAISGFKRDEIDITLDNSKLKVAGCVKNHLENNKYLYKGIANRNFVHQFTLNDTVVVKGAEFVDGLLVIRLENVIPEEKKSRKIPIGN